MRLSARGAQKTRDEAKKLQMYSKQWTPGDTLRVLYPIFWEDGRPEIAVGAIWGHNVSDIKGLDLKTAFIPSTTEFDQNGNPIGAPDITYQFSLIAGAFVQGAKAAKEASIMRKNFPTEAARREALSKLDYEFDTKNNMQAVKPIIGRAQYFISTEVLSVKIVNEVPDKDTIVVSSAPLSSEKIQKIYTLMDDPKYAPAEGDEFFEVEWKYPVDTDKGKSAKAATAAGLTPEYRLANTNPTEWALMQNMFGAVSKDAETITRRATRAVDPVKVRQALTNWSFMHSEDLDSVDDDSTELLVKHADLIKTLDLNRAITNEELHNRIEAAIRELEAAAPITPELGNVPIAGVSAPVSSSMAGTDTGSLPGGELPDLTQVTGAPTVQSLLNNPMNSGMSDDEMEAVDLSLT